MESHVVGIGGRMESHVVGIGGRMESCVVGGGGPCQSYGVGEEKNAWNIKVSGRRRGAWSHGGGKENRISRGGEGRMEFYVVGEQRTYGVFGFGQQEAV